MLTESQQRGLTALLACFCLLLSLQRLFPPPPGEPPLWSWLETPEATGWYSSGELERLVRAQQLPQPQPEPKPGESLRWTAGAWERSSSGEELTLGLPLNPNLADARLLEQLPRIGPALAGAILEERDRSGPFLRQEDLLRVKGIGPRTLEVIAPHLDWGAPASPEELSLDSSSRESQAVQP